MPFSPTPPPPNPKIKISKKWKNAWRYHNFTPAYQKSWLDDVWFLRYGVRWTGRQMDRWTEEVTYRGVCPKYPGNIILHLCPMSGNHMVHDSWDMEHERHNFLSFWTIFFSFYTPNKSENQNHEQIKTPGDIIILVYLKSQLLILWLSDGHKCNSQISGHHSAMLTLKLSIIFKRCFFCQPHILLFLDNWERPSGIKHEN